MILESNTAILAWIALGLAALPLGLCLLNLPLYRKPAPARGRPAVSVLIPARNEEANIAAAVGCVLASTGVELELVVLDDHSTDSTASILASIVDPRLRVALAPPLPPGFVGKQHACASLASLARHDIMVFVDADVRLAPDAVSRMAGFMQDNPVGLASGVPLQETRSWAEALLIPLIHLVLLGYLPMAAMRLSGLPALGAGCGQIMVARRDDYLRAGGHAAIRGSMHDGVTLPRAFRNAGIMTGLFDPTLFASCRMYASAREVWHGLGKNATEGMATPVALPVWTVLLGGGHVLPAVLMAVAPSTLAAAALACSIGLRLLLAWRFRQPVLSAVLNPVGVAAFLVIQWAALIRARRGRPSVWRGRAYPAQ